MQVHVINLDRSPDRLAEFCDVNRHLKDIFRFPAIDGRRLELDGLVRDGIVTKDILSMFTVGALGCAMSNMALWDYALSSGQALTICEDDAIFNHHFHNSVDELVARLPADWDLVYWAFNFDMFVSFDLLPGVSPCVATFDQSMMRAGTSAFQAQTISPQLFKARWVFGTCCYSISPRGVGAIRSKILPLRPLVVPLPEAQRVPPYSPGWRNVGLDNSINAIQSEIKSYVCFPPIVVSKNEGGKSTVQT